MNTALATPRQDTAIAVDATGTERIAGTRIKVSQIALEYTRQGLTPEQIAENHSHLSLAQVKAALTYYDSHHESIEAQIEGGISYADAARREVGSSKLATKLKAKKQMTTQQVA